MKIIRGIKDIAKDYDIFILDQWGVMHNGTKAYPYAIDCINYLKENNKKLVIISNSSKRKKSTIEKLPRLGFDPKYFDEVFTSGEMIWKTLAVQLKKYGKNLNKCFHIFDKSKEDGLNFREGLSNIEFVNKIEDAEFILACTPFKNSEPIDYLPILNYAYESKMIIFCANPDYETVEQGKNKNIFCMGTIANLYERMGGKVVIQGKPSIEIYKKSMSKFKNFNKSKVLAVGDSLFHDIQGAKKYGVDSVLITSGIHSNFFSIKNPNWKNKKNKLLKYNIEPTFLCQKFII